MLSPKWFIKPHIKAYNTPSNENFYSQVRQSLSEYLNMITSSPLFQEFTHLGVVSALCSTLETTPYFSVSLSLLVLRVQVALHL
jgi:lantibiotic modifying enzyme